MSGRQAMHLSLGGARVLLMEHEQGSISFKLMTDGGNGKGEVGVGPTLAELTELRDRLDEFIGIASRVPTQPPSGGDA